MILNTFCSKDNTLIKGCNLNTGLNPIAELFYGQDNEYTRHIMFFDTNRLVNFYTGGTFTSISNLKHTLKLTNTGSFDKSLLNGDTQTKKRTSSFDLIVFKVSQDWDEGTGYDYATTQFVNGQCSTSICPSNWSAAKTGYNWIYGNGVYSGTPQIIGTQHFDLGNENLEIDVTNHINGILTGDTNYGLGIAFPTYYESIKTNELQYVGFFTRQTQTIFEPHIQTIYNQHISDDRNNFYLDKPNKLYLYVNVNGSPTNLDVTPSVNVYSDSDVLISAYTGNSITHVTKGVYSIDLQINSGDIGSLYKDTWSGVKINNITRPNIELDFELRSDAEYYEIGGQDTKQIGCVVTVSGLKNEDKIFSGDIKKVFVSTRVPYTTNQTQRVTDLKYRIYHTEGNTEITLMDYHPIEITPNTNYFLLDTNSFLPSVYLLDIVYTYNMEVITQKAVIKFEIISQSNKKLS